MSFVLLFVIHVPTILLSVWNSNVESTWMTNLEKIIRGCIYRLKVSSACTSYNLAMASSCSVEDSFLHYFLDTRTTETERGQIT